MYGESNSVAGTAARSGHVFFVSRQHTTNIMPPKKRARSLNLSESEQMLKLFEEVSDDSSAPSIAESENSTDEKEESHRRPQGLSKDLLQSSEEEHDPYSDADGEYGSDSNYNPAEDERMLSESSESSDDIQESIDRQSNDNSDSDKTVSDIEPNPPKRQLDKSHPVEYSASAAPVRMHPTPSSPDFKSEVIEVEIEIEREPSPDLQSSQRLEPHHDLDVAVQSQPVIALPSNEQDIASSSVLVTASVSPQPPRPAIEALQPVSNTARLSPPGPAIDTIQPVTTMATPTPSAPAIDIPQPVTPPEPVIPNRSPTISESSWENDVAPIPQFDFDELHAGATILLDENTTPVSILNHLFTDELMGHIVTCMNAYAEALCNSNRPHTRGSRRLHFKPTDSTELKKFLGLCLLQGQVDLPSIRLFFSHTDPLYFHPIFPFIMSSRRFDQLLRCLCISELNSKGMDKVRDFAIAVKNNFQKLNNPGQALSLDESLMAFRGRLSFRQYIKSKKARYGVKFYELTTDDGYILNFEIYEGKQLLVPNSENNTESLSKLQKLVMSLMNPYLDKGHNLYMDNYYNSISLSKKLLQRKTHTTGTLRKDRKENPQQLFSKNVRKGQHIWQRKGRVYASMWKDKRVVHMITTNHHPRLVTSRNRYGQTKIKPVEVVDYNRHMSGIDKSDQMMSYYSTPKKTIRWYKKVFFHLFDMMVWNAYYLFQKNCDPNSNLLNFRESIIRSFLQLNSSTLYELKKFVAKIKSTGMKRGPRARWAAANNPQQIQQHQPEQPQPPEHPQEPEQPQELEQPQQPGNQQQTLMFGHWPEFNPVSETTKRSKVFLKCRVCTKNKIVKQTSYRCKGCRDNPPLCPGCFETWHSDARFAEAIEA